MNFERYTQIYDGGEIGTTLRPHGKKADISFSIDPKKNTRYRLFTVGETEQFYMWKDEPDGQRLYQTYTDALDSAHAIRDRYALNLSSPHPEKYCRRVYRKILWKPILSYLKMNPVPTEWTAGLTVSAKDLKVIDGGFIRMRIDIRLRKDGIDYRDVKYAPDITHIIDIPEGTYEGKTFEIPLDIPENTAHVCVFIEGKLYKGECYVEQPRLVGLEQNLLTSFNEYVPDASHMDWGAQYLSRKEWPEFRVRLNGKVIHTGEIFERSHRHSEWEIDIPAKLLGEENTLSYELISSYHDPLPYTLYEIGVVETPADDLTLVAVSEAAASGGKARVLVRTERPNMRVKLICDSAALSGKSEWFFREKGLHGILISCGEPCENAKFRLVYEGGEIKSEIKRIVLRGKDRVVTGTGDMIYVKQDMTDMEEYLAWYISEGIGDLVTVRPCYRWSGTRLINVAAWKRFRRLMAELNMKYVLMSDGREVPGLSAQPIHELLGGKGFYGVQLHERDGAHFYWPPRNASTLFGQQQEDLMQFAYQEDPRHTSSSMSDNVYIYADGKKFIYADRRRFNDYKQEHDKTVASMSSYLRDFDTRHTGPACTFKYMVEAGYKWLGAETMYQTMEPIMGFLRGVAKDNGMQTYGVHHAVQWSSTPHDTPARYRRYRLALYASYMQGATDINTEEGLWHLEEYYEHHHRFGKACRNHTAIHRDFFRYVSTHTRSGEFYTPIAFAHGRLDGINFFGINRTWGHRDEPQTAAEDSWKLIKAVYPMANPCVSVYRHGCPEDVPQGYHTGTPYGQIDAIPVEGKLSTWRDYGAVAFLGYNCLEQDDAERMMKYVKNGGTLLLTRAHLTSTTALEDIRVGNLSFEESALSLCDGNPEFVCDTLGGAPLSVCINEKEPTETAVYTDGGHPLVCIYKIGKGKIILFNTKEYPSHEAIRSLYEETMKELFRETTAKEPVWAETGDDVEFALYKQKDGGSHVYFLAVDWYRAPEPVRHATLRMGEAKYDIDVPFGIMLKCVTNDDTAIWAENEDGEVISINGNTVTVQGTGKVTFNIAKDGKIKAHTVDFSENNVQSFTL